MLNKYLLIVSALVAVLAYFVLYEKTETGPTEQNSPIVSVEIPNEFSELAQIGKVNYQNNCADCHGENAVGQQGVAPPLVHKIYEPSHQRGYWLRTEEDQFFTKISNLIFT
jgi:mono/diheme cytochrome c family protein